MITPQEHVRLELAPPRDRMVADRLRRAARHTLLALRTPALFLAALARGRRRAAPAPSRVTRILAIRTDRIGDMALTTPALQALREHYRRASITVLAPPAPLALLEGHPAVDRRVPLEDAGLPPDLIGAFDMVIDFTSDESLRGARLARRTGAPYRAGLSGWGRQAAFTVKGPRADPRRHVLDQNRDLLASLGVPEHAGGTALYVSAEERGAAQARLAALGAAAPRVAIHPGGHYPSQRWAPERFAEVITELTGRAGTACVVVCGPGEERLAQRILAATPDALPAGPTSIRSMMGLIACCDLFLGNNSGPLHVAGALGVPTVSVMGPTDPARFAPRGRADRLLRRALACSPCGRYRCWHHTCLRSLDPLEVVREAEAALARALPAREAR
jgi:heptosyltransferase-2